MSQLVSYELERQATEGDLQLVRERMEFALEATDSIIYAIDLETEESTEYGPVERVLGIEPTGLPDYLDQGIHPDDQPQVEQVFEAIRRGESEIFDVEFRTAPDLGGAYWISSTGFVQERTDQTASQLIGLATDVTERKQRETELTRQNERLDEFASIVSHDLRNPLSVAQGRLALAIDSGDPEHLEAVGRAHDRMEALIEDLLALAREGETGLNPESVDVEAVVESCWANVDTADASLAIEAARSIQADRRRLQQLFENLIRNAVEYGGDEVTISVGTSPEGFYVEDDGPSIEAADRERVLQPGYSTKNSGTGFGLSIVNKIADDHDWTFEICDGADGGARFEFTGVVVSQSGE